MANAPDQPAWPATRPGAGGADTLNRVRHINHLCDEFELAWRRMPRPVIEDFLALAPEDEREQLLRELIGLEAEFRRRKGERPELVEYRRRFPDFKDIIDSVDQQIFATIGSGEVAPAKKTDLRHRSDRKSAAAEGDNVIGLTIADRYEVIRLIGDGGMGSVYQAKQRPLDRWVALKLIHHDLARDQLAVKRFHREMRAAVRVQHPNTIRVYDFGTAETGELFLVMEYLDGKTLADALADQRPLDPARIDHIGLQVVKALAAAHSEGIVHRDLKPQNIVLLDHYGDHDFVKVLDFGLARFTEQMGGEESFLTADGSMVGTPHYMSPEQISGEAVDHRTDLYALGVLLFRMATGQEPFPAKTPFLVISKHLNEAPPSPSSIASAAIPQWLEKLILQLLEKDPARRPQSAEEIIPLFDRSQLKVAAPTNDPERVKALRDLHILDTDPEQVFDDLTSLASYICGTPLAAISLVDEDRQWFKSKVGMSSRETSRNISFCTHTIMGNELFLVADASRDPRFAESPLVQHNPHLRFYAGMPLATADGHNIGALCVMDRQPRQLTGDQIAALTALSRLVQAQIELRRDLQVLREAAGCAD